MVSHVVAVVCCCRFTARISEFMNVLDELSEGKYMRTMIITSSDPTDSSQYQHMHACHLVQKLEGHSRESANLYFFLLCSPGGSTIFGGVCPVWQWKRILQSYPGSRC